MPRTFPGTVTSNRAPSEVQVQAPARQAGEVQPEGPDPLEPLAQLFRDLRSSPAGLSDREAARRLEATGPNELVRRGGRRWPGELARQFTQPLAVLLAVAAVLAYPDSCHLMGAAVAAGR